MDKLFLVALPYIMSNKGYNEFNRYYYLAGFVSIISLFGFNFSIKSFRIKNLLIISLVLIHSIVFSVLVSVFVGEGFNILIIAVYAFFASLITIYQFEFLFNSQIKNYALSILFTFIFDLLAVVITLLLTLNLFYTLAFTNAAAFLVIYLFVPKGLLYKTKDVYNFYAAGLSAFVINTVAVAVLQIGKFIASENFSLEISNSFIFAMLLVSPMFYAGNIVERVIYSLKIKSVSNMFLLILALLALFLGYTVLLFGVIYLIPGLLPAIINYSVLKEMLLIILGATAVFSALHFPLNGVLFKELMVSVQKKLAASYAGVIFIFAVLYYYFLMSKNESYLLLLALIYSALFLIAGLKYVFVYKHKNLKSGKNVLLNNLGTVQTGTGNSEN
ncbi:MAG: hypothetical protein V1720_12755 [bacterium]